MAKVIIPPNNGRIKKAGISKSGLTINSATGVIRINISHMKMVLLDILTLYTLSTLFFMNPLITNMENIVEKKVITQIK